MYGAQIGLIAQPKRPISLPNGISDYPPLTLFARHTLGPETGSTELTAPCPQPIAFKQSDGRVLAGRADL